ncbi:carbohydrate ABC transporter permease [Arsenicitalea aurantiaca]|uniref:Carbohydrate ABC transporter permease n=1 Tax=Arsenicitalea aurantiaca TaxID=1783274 RepID=A0A433XAG6_9HYPH|nr:carbohydrate ABC transporter permease [Arsenicitalea aurantiaca]RUT31065.1 carbohydrate ABC transporter permease [Arsenicitalea aurantiaca]
MADIALSRVEDHEAVRASRRRGWTRAVIYGLLTVFALIYVIPLLVVVFNAFRAQPEIARNGLIAFPQSFQPDAWVAAWDNYCIGGTCQGMKRYFYNSLLMTIPATIISTLLGAMNGYILSKWRFKGSDVLFTCMLLGVFMPGQIALMPWAFILGKVGLSNSVYGLVLIHVVQGISFTTLFCRNYYVSIPDDLIKAARIDGAGFWRIFFKIILPLSPPILIVTVIWQFTGIWNEYLFGVVFTSGTQQPITAALVALTASGTTASAYDVMSAAVLIGAIPPLLVYFLGGKYFVRGLTQGAIK